MPQERPVLLYINLSRAWGGLEMFSVSLFKWLSARGWRILFAAEAGSRLETELRSTPFSANVVALKTTKYFDPVSFLKLRLLLVEHRVSIVHTFKSSDVFFAVLATLFLKKRKIKLVHHLQMLPKHARKDVLHRFIYGRLDQLIVITNQIAERVKTLWPVRPEIVSTLYHGIDADLYARNRFDPAAAARTYGVPMNKRVLCIVGQICEIKGQLLVLEAFAELREKYPELVLVIAGVPTWDRRDYLAKLQACIEQHSLQKSVIMPGFVADIPKLLSTVEVFALGSTAEPFGLVVIEAMAAGCLVVASDAGGVPEIITDNQDGILYKSGDSRLLGEAVARALELDAEQKAAMIAAAQEKVRVKFALPKFLSHMEEVYLQIVM